MLFKTMRATLGMLLVAGALLIAAAQPAAAKPGPSGMGTTAVDRSCGSGYFCVWYWSGYQTPKWTDIDNDNNWSNGIGSSTNGTINDNDMSWANNGTTCGGCDHVRVYQNPGSTTGNPVTLCVHRGQWTDYWAAGVTQAAGNRGSAHYWGGECRSGEPHIPFG